MIRFRYAVLVAGLCFLTGCSSNPGKDAPAEYTLLQEVNELLHTAEGKLGRPPARLADLARAQSLHPRAYEAVKSGEIVVLWGGALTAELKRRLWLIFGLGALQGAVGWWMVTSGLSERIEVSHYRLATHLVLALLIYGSIVWTLRSLSDREAVAASLRLRMTAFVLLALTFLQLYLGALVAGLRAGLVYNTWPEIDGAFIPSGARLWFDTPWWRNLFDSALTVQFEHRMTAYALFAVAIAHAVDARHARAVTAARGASWLVAAIALQAVLGILTLLNKVPIGLALAHQAMAIAVLTLVIMQAERLAARGLEVERHELAASVGQVG